MEREGEAAGGRSMQRLILHVCVFICAYTSLVWYGTLLLAVTVIGSDTYVIYDPIFTVHNIQHTNIHRMSVKSFIYMKQLVGKKIFDGKSCQNAVTEP
jgi:hypothetical protein